MFSIVTRFDETSTKTPMDTTFIPKINYVSMLLDSDTDTSMEINAMAMKYLKDEQLTQLTKLQAKNRLLQGKNKAAEKTALLQKILKAEEEESTPNVTTVGMSPNDLTFATKRYLERHGLLDGATGNSGSASDSTQDNTYHLRTNYSTMTSGSEDGPGQVTHEVLGTPNSRQTDTLEYVTPSPYSNRTNTPGYDPSIRTYNDSRTNYNDSRQTVGSQGTPKPNYPQSRLGDHNRFTPNRTNGYNTTGQGLSKNSTPNSHMVSPSAQRDAGDSNTGARGRYASPLITPAPNYQRHSPPERDPNTPCKDYAGRNRDCLEMPPNNCGRQVYGVRQVQQNLDMEAQNHFPARQHREEANDDDRILDITRLKQLPKLL